MRRSYYAVKCTAFRTDATFLKVLNELQLNWLTEWVAGQRSLNRVERSVKPFMMGRKNFLFANTPRGTRVRVSIGIYSVMETAKATALDPYRYLLFLLGAGQWKVFDEKKSSPQRGYMVSLSCQTQRKDTNRRGYWHDHNANPRGLQGLCGIELMKF